MRNLEKDEIEMRTKRETMLREGFRLFADKGIEPVSMQQVANACGVGIATLYRYYNTKLALVLDIGVRKWEEFADYVREEQQRQNTAQMTAAEALAFYLDCHIILYREFKDLLRFNQGFNNYIRHEGVTKEQLLPYLRSVGALAGMFHEIYAKGEIDGTIRTDVPEDKMFASMSHIMLAVVVRYAQGLVYAAEHEEDRTEEYELLKRMLLREFVRA